MRWPFEAPFYSFRQLEASRAGDATEGAAAGPRIADHFLDPAFVRPWQVIACEGHERYGIAGHEDGSESKWVFHLDLLDLSIEATGSMEVPVDPG